MYTLEDFPQNRHEIKNTFKVIFTKSLVSLAENKIPLLFKIISKYIADKGVNNSQLTIDVELY